MRIEPTTIAGVFVVEVDVATDERGAFARTFCAEEFADAGLDPGVAQCSVSTNAAAGTLRGMHFQQGPHGESKLVRCTRGRLFDVAVDARAGSDTFGRWVSFDLEAAHYRAVYLPPGVAHGYLTLESETEVFYQMSVPYVADAACGFRWDDPDVGIVWPDTPRVISDRDRDLPALRDAPFVNPT